MRIAAGAWLAAAGLSFGLTGCQIAPSKQSESTATPAVTVDARPDDAPAPIAWSGAADCLGQLRLLHAAARQGRLDESHEPPFAVLPVASTTSLAWIEAPMVPVIADLPLKSYEDRGAAMAAAPCLLLVEPARNLRAAHRVIGFEDVASQYQSGVRSERNPDYEAAQARVREAERDSRSGGPGVLRVGDPMLDLVGLVVGGVISAFGDLGDEDLDEALADLKETPRSRDRPVYRAYQFERSTVRAGKEAIIPIALQDLRHGGIWRAELRQREMRQFAVLEGLDPRDRDYEQQRAGALSWREFEHWQRQPPQLPLSALVAALAEADGAAARLPAAAPELLVDATSESAAGHETGRAGTVELARVGSVASLAPAAGPDAGAPRLAAARRGAEPVPPPSEASAPWPLPEAGRNLLPGPPTEPAAAAATSDPRVASVVRLRAGTRRGNGFYVGPRLVVTLADVVGAASVLDVTTSGGEEVLGLVVLRDPIRNLAVVHVPRAGPVTPFADVPALGPGRTVQVVELAADGRARMIPAGLGSPPLSDAGMRAAQLELEAAGARPVAGAPVFSDDGAVGLVARSSGGSTGSVIGIAEVAELLESEALAALR
jgi:S1-C subfamily serine protease